MTGSSLAADWPRASADIWLPSPDDVQADPRAAVTDFLLAEAALLDAGELDRWSDLLADDVRYWVPLVWDAAAPGAQLNLIYDDRRLLSDRVYRVQSGLAHAQDPPSRVVRAISNVRVRADGDKQWVAHSVFVLAEVRAGTVNRYEGRCSHVVRLEAGGLRIVRKRVDLAGCDQTLPNLSFLL